MEDMREKFKAFAEDVKENCSHISVREDENGPFIFALGLKETHTLQLRKIKREYVLELWYGKTAETEEIVEEPAFSEIEKAFERAREWLSKDAI